MKEQQLSFQFAAPYVRQDTVQLVLSYIARILERTRGMPVKTHILQSAELLLRVPSSITGETWIRIAKNRDSLSITSEHGVDGDISVRRWHGMDLLTQSSWVAMVLTPPSAPLGPS